MHRTTATGDILATNTGTKTKTAGDECRNENELCAMQVNYLSICKTAVFSVQQASVRLICRVVIWGGLTAKSLPPQKKKKNYNNSIFFPVKLYRCNFKTMLLLQKQYFTLRRLTLPNDLLKCRDCLFAY